MGYNKRIINFKKIILQLQRNNLKNYFGKYNALIFEDKLSSEVYSLFQEGKSEKEILIIIKNNMEEKSDEMY